MTKQISSLITWMLVLVIVLCGYTLKAEEINNDNEELYVDEGPRPLFIGDIISLKVSKDGISREALEEAFKEFEIIGIDTLENEWIVNIRSMKTGEYEIKVKNQIVQVEVLSTLDLIERDEIYSADEFNDSISVTRKRLLTGVAILCGLVFIGIVLLTLVRSIRKYNKKTSLSFKEKWRQEINAVNLNDKSCLGIMTVLLKEYLSYMAGEQLNGLSTNELTTELIENDKFHNIQEEVRKEIAHWLSDCDDQKYKRNDTDHTYNDVLKGRLINIINDLEVVLDTKSEDEKRQQV